MNEVITQFIQKQTCATICCLDEDFLPYCFSCFYAFDSEEGLLYFKSAADAHHCLLMEKNPFVAGTVLPDKLNPLVVKGIQFEAILLNEGHPLAPRAVGTYYKRHPLAVAMRGDIRTLQVTAIKMTDSTMGFGKKITWKRNVGVVEA